MSETDIVLRDHVIGNLRQGKTTIQSPFGDLELASAKLRLVRTRSVHTARGFDLVDPSKLVVLDAVQVPDTEPNKILRRVYNEPEFVSEARPAAESEDDTDVWVWVGVGVGVPLVVAVSLMLLRRRRLRREGIDPDKEPLFGLIRPFF